MEELLPCPYKHPIAELHVERLDIVDIGMETKGFFVVCEWCLARGPLAGTSGEAVKRYNARLSNDTPA